MGEIANFLKYSNDFSGYVNYFATTLITNLPNYIENIDTDSEGLSTTFDQESLSDPEYIAKNFISETINKKLQELNGPLTDKQREALADLAETRFLFENRGFYESEIEEPGFTISNIADYFEDAQKTMERLAQIAVLKMAIIPCDALKNGSIEYPHEDGQDTSFRDSVNTYIRKYGQILHEKFSNPSDETCQQLTAELPTLVKE